MFLEDGGGRPALRAVELDYDRLAPLDADLVHAVFVAVERQQPASLRNPAASTRSMTRSGVSRE